MSLRLLWYSNHFLLCFGARLWSRSFLARISDSLLVNGKLGDEMKKDGIPFLEKAAEANDPYGTLNFGLAYLSGTVIALDREKGKALVKKAADLGSDDAASMLESLA